MKRFIDYLRGFALIIAATGSLISCSNDFHDWDKDPKYTVSFNANCADTAPSAQSVTSGNKIDTPDAPVWTGNNFDGWYDSTLTTKYTFPLAITSNTTLHAKWKEDTAEVQNYYDFGSCAPTITQTFNIPSTDSFADAKSAIEATPAGNYILNITGDVDVVGENITQYADTNISLRGGGTIHKSSKVNGSLFNLYNLGNRIILRDATLKGNNDNIYSLVYVNGPDDSTEFVMLGGEIKDNNASGNAGGAVYVHQGTFTMRGGTIHDNNTSTNGGGVYVGSAGKFTMYDGTISGNGASYGGGVYVNGTFNMSGGIITGNTAVGGGVHVNNGIFTAVNPVNNTTKGSHIYGNNTGQVSNSSGTLNNITVF